MKWSSKQLLLFVTSFLFSVTSTFIVRISECAFFQTHPCGLTVGWPLGFAEYSTKWMTVNPDGVFVNKQAETYFSGTFGDMKFPILRGYPLSLENFSIVLFLFNSVVWLVLIYLVLKIIRSVKILK